MPDAGRIVADSSDLGEQRRVGAGFTMDRNDYRGDTMLGALHKSPSYTSYWLNAPPGGKSSTWTASLLRG